MDDYLLSGDPEAESAPPVHAPRPSVDASLVDPHQPTWRLVLRLAWPALMQQVLVFLLGLSDRLLAGRFQDLESELHVATQAAQTTAIYLSWVVSSFTVLVSVGSTALVARLLGAGQHRLAVHATNQSLLLAVLLGLPASLVAVLSLAPLVHLLHLEGEVADFAIAYLRPLFLLLVFQVIESAGIACLVGAGDTRTGFWVRAAVAAVNIPLALAFLYGYGPFPKLGFAGIALGTAISNVLGGLAVLAVLMAGRAGLQLQLALWRPRWDLLWRLLRISVPAGVDSLSVAIGQLWFVGMVNRLDKDSVAAHGIALTCESLGFLSGAAFATAAISLVGQNLGARQPARAAHSGWVAFGLGGVLMSLMGLLFYSLARPMFQLFCPDPGQQGIVEVGVPVLRLVAFAMPALASCIIFTNALRGAGDTRIPVLFTWLGFFVVRIPLAYLLMYPAIDLGSLGVWQGAGLGLRGAWLAMFADILLRGIFFLVRFAGGGWQQMRV